MKNRTYQFGKSTLRIEFGDITTSNAEVIVSSDDSYITMGGGVSAGILRAGGQEIIIDAAKKVPANVGDVIVTTAGRLRAQYVFHAITIGSGSEEVEASTVLRKAVSRCFDLFGPSFHFFPGDRRGRRWVQLRRRCCRDGKHSRCTSYGFQTPS